MGKQTEFQYDELQMFFGDDYKVSDYIRCQFDIK